MEVPTNIRWTVIFGAIAVGMSLAAFIFSLSRNVVTQQDLRAQKQEQTELILSVRKIAEFNRTLIDRIDSEDVARPELTALQDQWTRYYWEPFGLRLSNAETKLERLRDEHSATVGTVRDLKNWSDYRSQQLEEALKRLSHLERTVGLKP